MKRSVRLFVLVFTVLVLCTIVFMAVSSADTAPAAGAAKSADITPAAGAASDAGAVSDAGAAKSADITPAAGAASVANTALAVGTTSAVGIAPTTGTASASDTAPANNATPASDSTIKTLTVHYLDVGQADSILIQAPSGKTMLIDAGNRGDNTFIKDYINKLKIKKIDVLIATHPHEDHIGGMEAIVKAFDIGKIYMPKATATTKTYKNLLTAIQNKKLKITTAVPGEIAFDAALKVNIMAPNSKEYKDLNDYSVVIKMIYSKTSFLFTGDAEVLSEKEMIKNKYDLKADVLKVGHHGSQSSTSEAFLKAVSPKYAIVSVGEGNDYGLPDEVVLERLEAAKVTIFRTDFDGTVIAKSDGKTVTFDKKPASGVVSSGGTGQSASIDKSSGGNNLPASGGKSTYANDKQVSDEKSSGGNDQFTFNDKSSGGNNLPATGENKSSSVKKPASEPSPIADADADASRLVYYTTGGKSYHFNKDCPTFSRSKEILQGKLVDVIKMGKSDPCDKCAN